MLGEHREEGHLVAFDRWGNKGNDERGGFNKGTGLSVWAVDNWLAWGQDLQHKGMTMMHKWPWGDGLQEEVMKQENNDEASQAER